MPEIKSLDRDAILAADDMPLEKVEMPEWGGHVFVRTMTGAERDAFESEVMKNNKVDTKNIRARLVVRTIVDGDGKRIFRDNDADALGKKSAKAVDRLFSVAQQLNGLSKRDVDDLEKNSDSDQKEDST